jgi:hypothetical protein
VRREHHVAAAVQDPDLLGHRMCLPSEVGLGQHVEDDVAGRINIDAKRSERPQPAAYAQIDRDGTGDQAEVTTHRCGAARTS